MYVQIVADGNAPPRNDIIELSTEHTRLMFVERAYVLLDKSPDAQYAPIRVLNLDTNVCSGYSLSAFTDMEHGPLDKSILLTLPQYRTIVDRLNSSNPIYVIGDRHGAEVYIVHPTGLHVDTAVSGIEHIMNIDVDAFRKGTHVYNGGDLWFILNALFSKRPPTENNTQRVSWTSGDSSKPRVRIATHDPMDVRSRMTNIIVGVGTMQLAVVRRSHEYFDSAAEFLF